MNKEGLCTLQNADAQQLRQIIYVISNKTTVNVIEDDGTNRYSTHGSKIAVLLSDGYEFFYTDVARMRIYYLKAPMKKISSNT